MSKLLLPTLTVTLLILSFSANAEGKPSFPNSCENVKVASGTFRRWETPRVVPDEAFHNAREQRIYPSAFRGRPLLLHFWGTWCPPCLIEMPALARLQQEELVGDLLILPLSRDSGGARQVTEYFLDNDIGGLAVVTDRWGKLSHAVDVYKVPETLYVDRRGREIGRLTGMFDWDDPNVRQHLVDCLKL